MLPFVGLSLIAAEIAIVVAGPETKRRWPGATRLASVSTYAGVAVALLGLVIVVLV